MPITHKFVSSKPPASDSDQVGSVEWNDTHDYSGLIEGSGVVGRVAEFVTDTKTLQAANLIAPANLLYLVNNAANATIELNQASPYFLADAESGRFTIRSREATGIMVQSDLIVLPNQTTILSGGGTLELGGYTLSVPATGTAAIGAGTLSSSSINDVTGATHTHAITPSLGLLSNGAMQYQVITTGATPFAPAYSGFLLDGTTGGKTVLAVTNTKTLTLTATDSYNLTIPATGTAALLATANVFTANQKINVNSTTALLVEQDGVYDDQLVVDTTNGRTIVGTATTPFGYFHVQKDQNAETAFLVKNITSDTAARAGFSVRTNANQRIEASMFSTGFTSSGLNIPASGQLVCTGSGGFSIGASDAAGVVKLFAGGSGTANVKLYIAANGLVGVGNVFAVGLDPLTQLHVRGATTTTNAVLEVERVEARVSTASTGGANGFGAGLSLYAETATDGTSQLQGYIRTSYDDSTNATRKSTITIGAADTADRDGIKISATGTDVTLLALGKLAFTQTDLNEYIDSLADGYMDYRATTAHRFGDGTNQLVISATGDVTLEGTAKYERHVQIPARGSGTPANQMSPVTFFSATGVQASSAVDQYAGFQWEIPDDWDGTDAYVEIDWFPDSGAMSGTAALRWVIEYRSIAEGELINNGTVATVDNGAGGDTGDYAQYQTKHTRFTLTYNNANQPLAAQDHVYFLIHRDTAVTNDFSGTVTIPAFEIIYNSKGFPTSN